MPPRTFLKINPFLFLVLILVSGLIVSSRIQATALASDEQTASGNIQVFLPIILKDGDTPPPPEGEFVFYALKDANIVPPEGPMLLAFLGSQKMFVCDLNEPVPTNPLTYDQALLNVWTYLNEHVGVKNIATFRTLPEAENADAAQAFAVAALADRRPDGALTSLLVAAEKAPNDPMILVSTAGVLNLLGMPNEALAFLDKAATLTGEITSPLSISGAQIAANNRGHALMGLGKWAEAENVLRPVVEAESQLSEARTNLSIALLCQDKDEEAGYFYRLGERRYLYDVTIEDPPPPEEIGGHLPTEMIYDLSASKTLTLPGIPVAATAEQTVALMPVYEQMETSHIARSEQYATELNNVKAEISARQSSLPWITNLRYINVMGAVHAASKEPYILELQEAWSEADAALTVLDTQQWAEIDALIDSGLPQEQLFPACRSLLTSQWPSRKLALQAFEDARREYAAALYAEQTGLAANLIDPLHHQAASLEAKIAAEASFGGMVGEYAVHNTAYFAANWLFCLGSATETDETGEEPTLEESEACPEFVKGVKLAVKVAGLTINVNCEKVELEAAASQAMGLFGQVTVDLKKDTVTAFVGAKGKINLGLMELSAKEGLYITANKGGLTDAGMKVSTTGALNVGKIAGKIDGPGFEFSVVSAMQYITAGTSP